MSEDVQITIKVKEIMGDGKCPYGHKPGEVFNYPDDRGKICPNGYYIIYPAIRVLQFGGSFPWCTDKDATTLCCSDYRHPVVFEITRKKK